MRVPTTRPRQPKYWVEFKGLGHRGWTDDYPHQHAEIVAYSEAFLNRYLKGKTIPSALLKPRPDVVDLKYLESPSKPPSLKRAGTIEVMFA
jgi:hypothetical protein